MDLLPNELIIQIVEFDIALARSLSCCSKRYHEILKHVIWREVKIKDKLFTHRPWPHVIQNLKEFTHRLILYKNMKEKDFLSILAHGLFMSQVLCYLNPSILTSLYTDFTGPALEFALTLFPNLLELRLNVLPKPCIILELKKLRALRASFADIKYIEEILANHDFDSLRLGQIVKDGKKYDTSDIDLFIQLVSKQTSLKTLCFSVDKYIWPRSFDITPFQALVNLRRLDIYGMKIDDNSLNSLWKSHYAEKS